MAETLTLSSHDIISPFEEKPVLRDYIKSVREHREKLAKEIERLGEEISSVSDSKDKAIQDKTKIAKAYVKLADKIDTQCVKLGLALENYENVKKAFQLEKEYIDSLKANDETKVSHEEKAEKEKEIHSEYQSKASQFNTKIEKRELTIDEAISIIDEHGDFNIDSFTDILHDLRVEGESKIDALTNEIRDLKLNKQIDPDTKDKIIERDKEGIKVAKIIARRAHKAVKLMIKEASTFSNIIGSISYSIVATHANLRKININNEYKKKLAQLKQEHQTRLASIGEVNVSDSKLEAAEKKAEDEFRQREQEIDGKNLSDSEIEEEHRKSRAEFEKRLIILQKRVREEAVEEHKTRLKAENIFYKSQLEECKSERIGALSDIKDEKYSNYLEKYGYMSKARNNKHSLLENGEFKYHNYIFSFNLKSWLLKNALYIIVVVLFLVIIIADSRILSSQNITRILSQSSTKLFYSLGVAGLILLGGTDLSIGRMTAMGVMLSCLFTSQNTYTLRIALFNNAEWTLDMTGLSTGAGIVLAIVCSIVFCVFFTSIAGFFTAKFKMHPFITTLSTQLLIFGILMILFGSIASFNMRNTTAVSIAGTNGINLIFFAIAAVVIVWFIWNKTKFGKYMYAVGGNSEAAAVSGINVFWVTMGVFIMAGVLYGLGGFVEAARTPIGTPATGAGTELNAIAACVIGGVSFSGGIGKISGVVVGTIIFQGLTYCLTFLGLDNNLQYVFQGVIIMAAVALDSLKYLKKK